MSKQPKATFARLESGEWGVRLKAGYARAGVKIQIERRDGSIAIETIEAIVATIAGVDYCALRRSARPSPQASAPRPKRPRSHGGAESSARRKARRHGWDGTVGSPSYYDSGLYDEES
jgi:hypothetical protein